MPTGIHGLRMCKSVQKSGYKIGVTTIGLASTRLVEMLEKDDSDPDVAGNITSFREALQINWNFEDKFLAFDPKHGSADAVTEPIAGAPQPEATFAPVETSAPEPEPVIETPPAVTEPVQVATGSGEAKTAFLLYSIVKHAELVYTERFERDGKFGLKIEAPGILVLEVIKDGDKLAIEPHDFGDTEGAQKIRAEFLTWLQQI